MFTDLSGQKRLKLGLHIHTTRSDGQRTPEQAAKIYADAGYDAVVFTEHWKYSGEDEICGLKIISGCEYDTGGKDACGCVFHIIGYGMKYDPKIPKGSSTQTIIDMINDAGGLATVAHPAWSLNTPEQILALNGVYATEIYNAVSNIHESSRPDSSVIADQLACRGRLLRLVAADDTHYYEEEACNAFVMARAASTDTSDIIDALRSGDFYATQGPEIHIRRDGNKAFVNCSPAVKIAFFSNTVWSPNRIFYGKDLTDASYTFPDTDRFVRAIVTDADGKTAWSNFIEL